MKRLMLAFGVLIAISLFSCVQEKGETQDEGVPEPADIEEVEDSAIVVTGVAIDGAMNSVDLKVDEDTLHFSYPDLDPELRDSWSENDTLTVRYFETANGDSVAEVINDTES